MICVFFKINVMLFFLIEFSKYLYIFYNFLKIIWMCLIRLYVLNIYKLIEIYKNINGENKIIIGFLFFMGIY